MDKLAAGALLIICMGWSATVLAVPAHRSLTYPGGKAGPVTFQGKTHRQGCSECHRNGIFPVMRQGAEAMTMEKIEKGTQCGACHNGQMAFGIAGNCAGCHRPPQDR